MTIAELAVLGALNYAQTWDAKKREWRGATTRDVEDVLLNNKRIDIHAPFFDSKEIGYVVRRMSQGFPVRRAPLVEVTGRAHGGARRWRMTQAGVEALSA